MRGYGIIIDGEEGSYSAYVAELPGCITTGRTVAEIKERMREAIALHIEVTQELGEEVAPPSTVATTIVEVVPAT